jgi:hypothetical protein
LNPEDAVTVGDEFERKGFVAVDAFKENKLN